MLETFRPGVGENQRFARALPDAHGYGRARRRVYLFSPRSPSAGVLPQPAQAVSRQRSYASSSAAASKSGRGRPAAHHAGIALPQFQHTQAGPSSFVIPLTGR